MKVAIRTDASLEIGTGHVMRCLTLADELKSSTAGCRFICRAHDGNLIDLIRRRGFDVSFLPMADRPVRPTTELHEPSSAHTTWLGADWASDAAQTRAALGREPIEWLIVDHYALDARWERTVRPVSRKLMVIDDLANRPHDCDALLDQNWFANETDRRYDSLLPDHTVRLLGPRYALIGPEYALLRAGMSPRDGAVRRIMIFLGGSDSTNQTARVLDALTEPDLAHLALDVVLGANHPDPVGIAARAAARPATTVHWNLPSLAELMIRADLAIGAGGVTGWERMSLGLPSIVISIASNQIATNIALHHAGYITYLGEMSAVGADVIVAAVRHAMTVPGELQAQSAKMRDLVCADGAAQVSRLLLGLGGNHATPFAH